MRIRWMAAAVAVVLVSGCSGGDGEEPATATSYYLSLGDSLTVGVQPDENGNPRETSDGYTDVLYRDLYDSDSTLRHERMGCGGEDTTTFLQGGIAHCDQEYEDSAQIEAAEDFLAEHEGLVDLVTLSIGGNNFTGCVEGLNAPEGATIDTACVNDGLERIESEIPEIVSRLRAAAGPDTQIVAMTYYNPFLAGLLIETEEPEGSEGAEASSEASEASDQGSAEAGEGAQELDPQAGPGLGEAEGNLPFDASMVGYATDVLEQLNESLRASYAAEDIRVADIDTVFDSGDFEVPQDSTTGMSANLQAICDLTWMCDTEQGPDIHTNKAGAQEIAAGFAEQVS